MRIGLLADIHEAVGPLSRAVRALEARGVESTVMLGDLLETGERIAETVALVARRPGPGVWGNHDLGLCGEVDPDLARRFPREVMRYFARLRPWVELEDCRFQHIDPHLDPTRFEDLWRFPTPEERIAGFAACGFRRVFVGHQHAWGALTPERRIEWDGERPLELPAGERCLVVVHAVTAGWCAVLDTERDRLEPLRVGAAPVSAR